MPTEPRNFNLEMIDTDPPRVRVTWTAPLKSHGDLRSYRLMWGKREENVLRNTVSLSSGRSTYIADRMSKLISFYFILSCYLVILLK